MQEEFLKFKKYLVVSIRKKVLLNYLILYFSSAYCMNAGFLTGLVEKQGYWVNSSQGSKSGDGPSRGISSWTPVS